MLAIELCKFDTKSITIGEYKMSAEAKKFYASNYQMRRNLKALDANEYPGRGIVLGRDEQDDLVEAYWVEGRSPNSRNRVLAEKDDTSIETVAHDPSKVEDPSLIIYNAMRSRRHGEGVLHIVSNGDQTDTVYETASHKKILRPSDAFCEALFKREFEPDDPNFTARITGSVAVGSAFNQYNYSIIRRNPVTGQPEHTFGGGQLADIPAGAGLCFHTYERNGNPLPTFEAGPYAVPMGINANEIAEELWDSLNDQNRVGLAVRTFDSKSGEIKATRIINQLEN